MTVCTCGASGAIDKHAYHCELRAKLAPRVAGSNRVVVGLPERLERSKAALRSAEKLTLRLQTIYAQRAAVGDKATLDVIGELLGFKVKND